MSWLDMFDPKYHVPVPVPDRKVSAPIIAPEPVVAIDQKPPTETISEGKNTAPEFALHFSGWKDIDSPVHTQPSGDPGQTTESIRSFTPMCKNAVATAGALMKAIEPTVIQLLTLAGVAATPDGQAAIKAFDAALQAVEAWTPGTTPQVVVEAINAFTLVFNTLPLPAMYKALESIISAGIVTVIGVITANSPAPAHLTAQLASVAPEDVATDEEMQHHFRAAVIHQTTHQVQALVPEFKRSIFTSAAGQYKKTWNSTVESGNLDAALKV